MFRRMADVAFRDAQRAQVFNPRVRVVNEFCDELSREKPGLSVPYVAPHYNAANATILSLSSNPGPRTSHEGGSGFLSRENDDPIAERMSQVFATVGLSDEHVLPWNAYPWHVHQAYPNGLPAGLLAEGLDPLKKLLELHPQIRTVVAHGGDAKRAMRQFTSKKRFAPLVAERSLKVWEARHTSNRAFVMDATERAAALEAICQTYREAMVHVGVQPTHAARPLIATMRATPSSGTELVIEVGEVLSGRTDGATDSQTRSAVRAYLATMSPKRRTELLIELVTQRLNS
jgi:hypothetical protein